MSHCACVCHMSHCACVCHMSHCACVCHMSHCACVCHMSHCACVCHMSHCACVCHMSHCACVHHMTHCACVCVSSFTIFVHLIKVEGTLQVATVDKEQLHFSPLVRNFHTGMSLRIIPVYVEHAIRLCKYVFVTVSCAQCI